MSDSENKSPKKSPQGKLERKPKGIEPINEGVKNKQSWIGENEQHHEQLRKAAEIPPKPKKSTNEGK